jgi:hypothetical protein
VSESASATRSTVAWTHRRVVSGTGHEHDCGDLRVVPLMVLEQERLELWVLLAGGLQ